MQNPHLDGSPEQSDSPIEHLVTWQEESGRTLVLGLDEACRPVYLTALDPD